ncbi:type I-A CRISPR-associated protein Csa5 [bacterium]|nr:MAG: type I-A CRISPR-associated protein Csa5 [bacterium]
MNQNVSHLVNNLSKILAVLVAEGGGYTYVDKLSYAPSIDLALFYIREALRDFHSLIRRGTFENPKVISVINELKDKLGYVANDLNKLASIVDRRELRTITSLISSKALALAANLTSSSGSKKGE